MKTITLLIPVYNEESVLPQLFKRLDEFTKNTPNYQFEFLFINDGSTDKSFSIIAEQSKRDSRISYINLSRNFGKEIAMIAGIDHVKSDALVIIDADLQDPPELIQEMISHWEDGYDDVYARRNNRQGETWLKKKTSQWYYRILQKSTNIPIQIDTGDFRLLDRRCIEALQKFRESQRNTKAIFSWIGYKKKEIFYDRDPRLSGQTKWNYRKLLNLAIDGITSFTTAPLRMATIFGFIISLIAFIWIIYLLVRPLFGVSTGAGYSSLMAVILFLGGVQLLSLGIIGEYIGRIFIETKNRPLYLIEEYHAGNIKKTRR
ncbi:MULTISPECIES: glycosyltransferase family 2 protein [unclassified Candidatus Nanosynbacter]|uniref:glycosyltransferase family 2 protein n=1 Tax=unclassified Candidatus Nanosynbacter TaxID=2725944 RepID=UPI001FB65F49|nr:MULTISPECIES: glycosyltransferase family 2 protein [unclassified Candidatus Nanosynbacter]MCJ1963649.1 glycosyltransferase family 2 protein [Candidatus Nanosynbacter sp. TM7-033]UOG68131.1 glycosyltransferase family 2 protein [Candidatus Nanosynbacter sp. HMT-352]